ncbi:MAG TPA: hypothetical protein VFH66_10875 [Mycobacteriales bacterium]|nr:hypothetical protein [Mycobacteriales bacterium]
MKRIATKEHPDYGKTGGVAEYAAEHFEEATEVDEVTLEPGADVESNELTVAAGFTCRRCGNPIEAGSDARLTGDDGYVHESCPVHIGSTG